VESNTSTADPLRAHFSNLLFRVREAFPVVLALPALSPVFLPVKSRLHDANPAIGEVAVDSPVEIHSRLAT